MWETAKLGEIMEIARGGSPRPIKSFITNSDDGINWIKIGDTEEGGKYIHSTKEKIKKEGISRSRRVKEGDFLLSNSMSFGRPYILKTDGCIHDGWLVLTNYANELKADYLYFLLSSPMVSAQFEKSARGSTVRNLNIDLVSQVVISYPTLAEQQRIVTKLDATFAEIDSAIDAAKTKSSEIEKLKISILTEALNTPSDMWETVNLGKVCEVLDKFRKPITKRDRIAGEFPYYGATGIVDWVADYIFDEKLVLVGEDGAKWGIGDTTAFIADGKYWVNNHAHVLRPIENLVTHEWLAYYLTSLDLQPWITGLTVPKLNQAQLCSIPISLPALEEQQRIVAKLDAAFAEIDGAYTATSQKISELNTLKSAFLSQELTTEAT